MQNLLELLTKEEKFWLEKMFDLVNVTLESSQEMIDMALFFGGTSELVVQSIGFSNEDERQEMFSYLRAEAREERARAVALVGEAYRFRDASSSKMVCYEGVDPKDVPSDDVVVIQFEVRGACLLAWSMIDSERRGTEEWHLTRLDGTGVKLEMILPSNYQGI